MASANEEESELANADCLKAMAAELTHRMTRDDVSRAQLMHLIEGDAGRISRWLQGKDAIGAAYAKMIDQLLPPSPGHPSLVELRANRASARELPRQSTGVAGPLRDNGTDASPRCFMTRETLYEAAALAITQARPRSEAERVIRLASFHGHGGARVVEEASTSGSRAMKAFDHAIWSRLTLKRQPWKLLLLFNVTNQERLDALEQRILNRKASQVNIRAFVAPNALPLLSPLIIGEECVFLAAQDDRLYRVRSGIELQGDGVTAWARDYFDELWDIAPFRIRSPVSVNEVEWARLVRAVGELGKEAHSPHAEGSDPQL